MPFLKHAPYQACFDEYTSAAGLQRSRKLPANAISR